jgi:hypothetical protein
MVTGSGVDGNVRLVAVINIPNPLALPRAQFCVVKCRHFRCESCLRFSGAGPKTSHGPLRKDNATEINARFDSRAGETSAFENV